MMSAGSIMPPNNDPGVENISNIRHLPIIYRPPPASTDNQDPPGPPGTPQNPNRKFHAKWINEHLKIFSSYVNTLSAAIIGAAAIVPFIGRAPGAPEEADVDRLQWCAIAILLHILGHMATALFIQKED